MARHLEAMAAMPGLSGTPSARTFTRWAFVAIFYAAMHWVQATLEQRHHVFPSNHADRDAELQNYYLTTRGYLMYQLLKDRSEQARYRGVTPPDLHKAWSALAEVERDIV